MKTISIHIRIIVCSAALIVLFNIRTAAQQSYDPTAITQEIDMKIDRMGDAQMEFRMKMTAAQWLNYKNSMAAQNANIFMRDLERNMSGVILENFKNELNENTRSSVNTITARNMATYKGDGKWELRLDMKDPNITQISDHIYLLAGNLLTDSGLAQQLQKIFFPDRATNVKLDTDTYGNAMFTYTLNVEKSSISILLILGILLCVAGVVMYAVPLINRKPQISTSSE